MFPSAPLAPPRSANQLSKLVSPNASAVQAAEGDLQRSQVADATAAVPPTPVTDSMLAQVRLAFLSADCLALL